MPWIEVALPGTLLLMKFLLKLFVDRSATSADMVSALLALPVDIVFLSASLLAGYTIANSTAARTGLTLFGVCLVLAVLIVFVWRRTDGLFAKDKYWSTAGLALINFLLSSTTLVIAVNQLAEVVKK